MCLKRCAIRNAALHLAPTTSKSSAVLLSGSKRAAIRLQLQPRGWCWQAWSGRIRAASPVATASSGGSRGDSSRPELQSCHGPGGGANATSFRPGTALDSAAPPQKHRRDGDAEYDDHGDDGPVHFGLTIKVGQGVPDAPKLSNLTQGIRPLTTWSGCMPTLAAASSTTANRQSALSRI